MNIYTHRTKIFVIIALLAVIMAVWLDRRGKLHPDNSAPGTQTSTATASAATVSTGLTNAPVASTAPGVDMSGALDQALKETDPIKRAENFGSLLTLWFEQNPEGALA